LLDKGKQELLVLPVLQEQPDLLEHPELLVLVVQQERLEQAEPILS
jgi:hypothetical protein